MGRPRTVFFDLQFFNVIDTEEKAYALGIFYADGNITHENGHHTASITLQECDRDILEKLMVATKFSGKLLEIKRAPPRKNQVRLCFASVQMCKDLVNKGCYPRKSLTLKFPTKDQVPDKLISHFIRGYYDGDGCITWSRNKVAIFTLTSTLEFCNEANQKLGTLVSKGTSYISKHRSSDKNVWVLGICQSNCRNVCDYLYKDATIWMERKRQRFIHAVNEYDYYYKRAA